MGGQAAILFALTRYTHTFVLGFAALVISACVTKRCWQSIGFWTDQTALALL